MENVKDVQLEIIRKVEVRAVKCAQLDIIHPLIHPRVFYVNLESIRFKDHLNVLNVH